VHWFVILCAFVLFVDAVQGVLCAIRCAMHCAASSCQKCVIITMHTNASCGSPLDSSLPLLLPLPLPLLLLLQAFVVGRLQDSKVEVRGLSAATLSGIIKALPAHEMESLRRNMVASVRRLFNTSSNTRSKRGRGLPAGLPVVAAAAAAAADGSVPANTDAASAAAFAAQQGPVFLAEAQAVVQGLKAFVLSSPYDVPGWMPEVLMALVAAANSRNPLVRALCCEADQLCHGPSLAITDQTAVS
jgi:hypothetical protein